LIVFIIILLALIGAGLLAGSKYYEAFPKQSAEIVPLDPGKRDTLVRLRTEEKFEPHDHPPLGYTGIATPQDGVVARAAVNDVLDSVLSRENGAIAAREVSGLIGRGMKRVSLLETEDRDRTSGYMVEIWYILGFKGATGRFAYGSGFTVPTGYGEPLPPGWKSPTEPRQIGRP
jgi:hypothetical protein